MDSGKTRTTTPGLTMLAGGFSAWLSTYVLTSDFICRAWGAAVVGAFAGYLAGAIGQRSASRLSRPSLRIALAVCLGAAIGLPYRPAPAAQFEKAFGIRPSPGVSNLEVNRVFMGPDSTTLIRFDADRTTLDQIVSVRLLDEDREILERHPPATDWAGFWDSVFGTEAKLGGKGWQSVKPMTSPKVYRRRTDQETMTLLWDAASGRAYAIYGTL